MVQTFQLPKWGLTMEEGVVEEWLVDVGSRVEQGQPLATIATDKIEVEFPSPTTGVVAQHLAAPGETVPVESDIVIIAADEDDYQSFKG